MRGRGYGAAKRTMFAKYRFYPRDMAAAVFTVVLTLYLIAGKLCGNLEYSYFPVMLPVKKGAYELSLYAAYAILAAMPILVEFTEEIKWKHIKSEI